MARAEYFTTIALFLRGDMTYLKKVHKKFKRIFVQNLAPKLFFQTTSLILKRMNLEICEHSSFFNYLTRQP